MTVITTACQQGNMVRDTVPKIVASLGQWPHEIIVVDDQSTDGCCHDLGPDVLIVPTPERYGVSRSRILGVSRARGEILLFTDPHCTYPGDALANLVRTAWYKHAICLPATTSLPRHDRPRYGGRLVEDDRGIRIERCWDGPVQHPALVGSIYAVKRHLYDWVGGWPMLPGWWGYSEQALSLAAWFQGLPIYVVTEPVCDHRHYHADQSPSVPYTRRRHDFARNAHAVHRVFFPTTYESYWKPKLFECFGDDPGTVAGTDAESLKELIAWIWSRNVRQEIDFYRHILGREPEPRLTRHRRRNPEKTEPVQPDFRDWTPMQEIDYQRRNSKPQSYPRNERRQTRAIDWFNQVTPGCCFGGKRCLDVGCRDGYVLRLFQSEKASEVEGVELVPEVAEWCRQQGLPVQQADICSLPYEDSKWHIVTCIHVLEHTREPEKALKELVRVTRRGGWILLVIPNHDRVKQRWAHHQAWGDEAAFLEFLENAGGTQIGLDMQSLKIMTKPGQRTGEIRVAVRKRP